MSMEQVITDGRSTRALTQRKARREKILTAAQNVISARGYQATSVADVIEAAGISRGTFYLYFDSREALFHELIDGFIQKLRVCIKPVSHESADPVLDLYKNVRRVVDLLFDNLNLTVILLREAVGINKDVDKKLNDLYAFVHGMIARALVNGARRKVTRKVNEPIVAIAILGCIKEVLYQYLVVEETDAPGRETLAKELLEFGFLGLRQSA